MTGRSVPLGRYPTLNMRIRVWHLLAVLSIVVACTFFYRHAISQVSIRMCLQTPGPFIYRASYHNSELSDRDFYVVADFIDTDSGENIYSCVLIGKYGNNDLLGFNVSKSSLKALDNHVAYLNFREHGFHFAEPLHAVKHIREAIERAGLIGKPLRAKGDYRNHQISKLRLLMDQSISDSDIPLLQAAQEFTASTGMFQELNGEITRTAVLATYRGSKALGPSGGPEAYSFALCGVKTNDQNGEQFVVLHMMNTGAMWYPMMFPVKKAKSYINVIWSRTKPTRQQIEEQTGFPELGYEWEIDNELLFQKNWEEFVIGKPPADFIKH